MEISAVIITFNEDKNIQRCLDSLLFVADEIVVVDSHSTDQTETICNSYQDVKFVKNKFKGHIEQKNFAMQQAKHDLVLSLDADECLSDELIAELKTLKSAGLNKFQAYSMPRLNNYCGQWIKHSGWYPDRKVRLWDRNIGQWGGHNPHDKVIINEGVETARLKGDILHFTYHSTKQHDEQIEKFTSIAAQESLEKNKKVYILTHLIIYPFYSFIKVYFIKLGFLDGYYGLVLSLKHSRYKYLKYFKLYQLKKTG